VQFKPSILIVNVANLARTVIAFSPIPKDSAYQDSIKVFAEPLSKSWT